jgi:hypothetical protein
VNKLLDKGKDEVRKALNEGGNAAANKAKQEAEAIKR